MKIRLLLVFLTIFNNLTAQEIAQSEFNKIHNDVSFSLFRLTEPFYVNLFSNKFKLSRKDREKLKSVFSEDEVVFNIGNHQTNFVFPYYVKALHPQNLKLTIFAYSKLPKRENENFNRANYYFVLTTKVSIRNDVVEYNDTKLIVSEDKIIKWFLKGFKGYLDKTKPIHKKYDFIPPPPPLPPDGLK